MQLAFAQNTVTILVAVLRAGRKELVVFIRILITVAFVTAIEGYNILVGMVLFISFYVSSPPLSYRVGKLRGAMHKKAVEEWEMLNAGGRGP